MTHKAFNLLFVLAFIIGLVVIPTPQSARAAGSWYVAPTGNDNNDCLSPVSACATINGANGKATAGDTINIAVATYSGSGTEVVLIDRDINLSGGWDIGFSTQSGTSIIDAQGQRRGIFVNSGTVAVVERLFIQNGFFDGAFNGGGGIRNDGNLTLNDSTLSNNSAINCGEGGSIYNAGILTVNTTTIQNGSTVCGGAGLENIGTATLTNTSVKNNSGVAAIDNSIGTLTLNNSIVSNTTGSGHGINNFNNGTVNLNASTISGNSGAGILIQNGSLEMSDSSIHNNSGGGIYLGVATATTNNSIISNNGGNGGIYSGGATLSINNSSVQGNTTGIYVGCCGGVQINSSTFANNSGFGVVVDNFANLGMNNVTVSDNLGGILVYGGGTTLSNTIVAGNILTPMGWSDCAGVLTSGGNNIIGNTTGCTISAVSGDQLDVDPNLSTFLPEQGYYPLLANSPAIDVGNPATCQSVDQRGVARVGNCDIGAYEYTTPGSAVSLSVESGSGQLTETTLVFPKPLQAAALDSQGSPVTGVTIDFAAPASGASGTFAYTGTNTTLVDTDAGGIATTSIFTANDQVGAYAVSASAPGLGSVDFNLEQIIRPANDNFANAQAISPSISTTADITDATKEPDEPQNCYSMDRTVWYSFTPTESMVVRAHTQGGDINGNVNIYRAGSGISDLQFLSCTGPDGSPTFLAEANQTYYLQAGSAFGEVGSIQVNLEQVPPPANDNFANAIPIGSLPSTIDFDTTGATFESGEPASSCAYPSPPYRTAWFAFTASQDGPIFASIPSSNFSPFLAVYRGTDLNTLGELRCGQYSNRLTIQTIAGQTYYFQVGGLDRQGGTGTFLLEPPPPPVADFYYYPGDPSRFDTIQFCDNSFDPGDVGFQSRTWDFGDGATSIDNCASHQYTADGDYTVQHSVTTVDGRTASTSQIIHVRTHDVAITKVTAPRSANSGQTKAITVAIRNTRYPETVTVDLYKSAPGGEVWISSLTLQVPVLSGNKTKQFTFNYTFTSQDAQIGKVTFRAVATINGANDAFQQDNTAISSPPTKVGR